ncbi:MAG: winged helix-turn-helix transcriptional regulator [Candidatus Aenigmarchaeota archaeon]|nr:winged helix-turn-helix transcriptional regulator [Candidatus Aenigmarchaeota archaeon]
MPFHSSIPAEVIVILNFSLPYLIVLFLAFYFLKLFTKRRNYGQKIIEIKEAPLEISNLLKDSKKRKILRSLEKEKKYVSAISNEINDNAPRTRYHLKQLEKAGLVKSFKLAREAYFFVTKKGKWAVDAINYYYPETNLELIVSRIKKIFGIFEIRRLMPRKKEQSAFS